jgi:hypothetical protein
MTSKIRLKIGACREESQSGWQDQVSIEISKHAQGTAAAVPGITCKGYAQRPGPSQCPPALENTENFPPTGAVDLANMLSIGTVGKVHAPLPERSLVEQQPESILTTAAASSSAHKAGDISMTSE